MRRRLSTTWGRVRNVPGLPRDLVLIAILLTLGTVSSVYLFSKYDVSGPFHERIEFAAEFDQAPAVQLASRQELRIAGVPVGKIEGAEVSDAGNARLTFSIEPGHTVYENARLVMRSKTPLNIMYVALDPGGPPAKPLGKDDVIPVSQTERVLQPYELLDELDSRARGALTDLVLESDVALASAPQELPEGLAAADGATSSFQPVVDALQDRRANLRHLVTAVSEISTAAGADDERLASLAAALEETLSVVSARDEELGASLAQLPGVTSTLRDAMSSAAALTDELSPTLESLHRASGELPKALSRLTSTVSNARALFEVARPVISKARPVIADLRPLTADLSSTLGDLSPVTSNLPGATAKLVPWLDNLGAFVYNTASSFSLGDANGGLGRANLVVKVYDPLGGMGGN
jgi:phospholipid/cholesterol/gamma-HCH transport system substrate-binding protein